MLFSQWLSKGFTSVCLDNNEFDELVPGLLINTSLGCLCEYPLWVLLVYIFLFTDVVPIEKFMFNIINVNFDLIHLLFKFLF